MTMVMAILIIMCSITFMSLQPALRQQRVSNAYNTVLSAMRQGRDNAVSQRTSYVVTIDTSTTPHKVTVGPTFAGFQGSLPLATYTLPIDVKFDVETGIPTANTKTPDQFGTGNKAVDFGFTGQGTGAGGKNTIYFCPD